MTQVILGVVIATACIQTGFWCAIWALREARGRPLFGEAATPESAEEQLFESLMG